MDRTICYLNTDLELISPVDLTALARVLKSHGISPLHVTLCDDDCWHAIFETADQHAEPETNIVAMVAAVESLVPRHQSIWHRCTQREFNIGYDCGDKPWAFNQGLSKELLGRIAALSASLRWTLYPDREPTSPTPGRKRKRETRPGQGRTS